MGLFDRLFNRGITNPQDTQNLQTGAWLPNRYIPGDLKLSPDETLSLSAVYGCLRVISEALATSPWKVFQREGEKRVLLQDDLVSYLLNVRPNPETTAQAFREVMAVQALVYGNSYAEIVFDGAGRVKELWAIPSEFVRPWRSRGSELVNVSRTETRMGINGEPLYLIQDRNASEMNQHYLPASNVYHLKALASVNQFLGDSPVGRASRAISLAHAAERYAINYYGSNATVGGVLELPRTFKDENEEKIFKEKFNASRSGVGQAFGTLFVGPGTKYSTVGHNAEESQVVQSRNFSVEDIIRYFGVPPHLVGVSISSQGYGRNLAELGMTFTRHTLAPWTKRFSQEADYKLFAQRAPWKFSEIDTTWLTHGDALARAQAMAVLRQNGVITANEWRESEGMNDIGDPGELFLVTNNLTIMEEENLEIVVDTPEEKAADDGDTAASEEGNQEPASSEKQAETETEQSDLVGATSTYSLILASHQKRLTARFADLQKKLKNGVLQEKMEHAKEWSRNLTSQQLQTAGLNPPPNWMAALDASENGGDAKKIAQSLEGIKQ